METIMLRGQYATIHVVCVVLDFEMVKVSLCFESSIVLLQISSYNNLDHY